MGTLRIVGVRSEGSGERREPVVSNDGNGGFSDDEKAAMKQRAE